MMQSVLLTSVFLRHARALNLTDDDVLGIASLIASDPFAGDLMAGTGGARKLRHPAPGTGKSGGYRTIHYFGGEDVPVFLLSIYGKGEKGSLTKAERNTLAKLLPGIAVAYRKEVRRRK